MGRKVCIYTLVFWLLSVQLALGAFKTDNLTITSLPSKSALATDSDGKVIAGSGSGYLNFTTNETSNINWAYTLNASAFQINGVSLNNTAYSWGNHATAGYGNANYSFGTNNFNGTGNFTTTQNITAGNTTITNNLTVDTNTLFVNATSHMVGIGTTGPGAKLEVDTVTDVKGLIVKGMATQTANLQEWQNSSGAIKAAISPKGYIGIGKEANEASNYVIDALGTTGNVFGNIEGSGATGFRFNRIGANAYQFGVSVGGVAGFSIYDETGNTVRMVILNSNGNVGIGTTSPAYTLDVNGTINTTNSAFAAGWNGNTTVPTRDDVYDKVITLGTSNYTAPTVYNATVNYTQPNFNFIAGANVSSIALANDTVNNRVNVTINTIDTTGGAGGNPFNQTLNTTDSVEFAGISIGGVNLTTTELRHHIGFTITNGASALTTGWYCCARAVNNFTASGWEILSKDGTVGNITVVVKKYDFPAGANNYTETNFTNTSGTEPPNLALKSFNEDTSLGSFNTTIVYGERFGYNITAVDTIKGVDITIYE